MNLNHSNHVHDVQTLDVASGDFIGSVYPSSLGKRSVNVRPYGSTLDRIVIRSRSPSSIETGHPVSLPNQSHRDLIYSTHGLASSARPRPRVPSSSYARFPVLEPPGSSLILGHLSFSDQDSIEPCGRRQETLRASLMGLWCEVAQTRRGRGWSK